MIYMAKASMTVEVTSAAHHRMLSKVNVEHKLIKVHKWLQPATQALPNEVLILD